MERERKGKSLVIALLLVTVLSLSVAFAATLSSTLNINGTANIGEAKWNVYFKSASVSDTSDLAATTGPTITGNNLISYGVSLEENKTFIIEAVVRNDGTYDAKLNALTVSGAESYSDIITYTVTGMSVGDTITAGQEKNLTITVSMGTITNNNIEQIANGLSLTLTAAADFVQA